MVLEQLDNRNGQLIGSFCGEIIQPLSVVDRVRCVCTFVDAARLVLDMATSRSIPRDLSIIARTTATFIHDSSLCTEGAVIIGVRCYGVVRVYETHALKQGSLVFKEQPHTRRAKPCI